VSVEVIWGVDVGVKRSVICSIGEVTSFHSLFSLKGEQVERLQMQAEALRDLLRSCTPPDVVMVEQPTGRFRNPPLDWTVGALSLVIAEEVGCPVWHTTPPQWKKAVIGNAQAKKPEIAAWASAEVAAEELDFDESDALAIATYAAQNVIVTR
jgi:Holliday junction resolvasome RuvABC endonuclease subunit